MSQPDATHLAAEWKYASPLLSCRFDPSGRFVFAGAQDCSVGRWELSSGKVAPLVGHDSWVRSICFQPQGELAITGGYEGRVIFWPLAAETPAPLRAIEAHQGWIRAMAVSPDGATLATAGNDGAARLWNIADGSLVQEFAGHGCHVYNVAFHPDGRSLVSADLKGVLRHWDLASGEELRRLDAGVLWKYDGGFAADIGGIRGMAFRPDGKELACIGITEVSNAFAGIGSPLAVLFDWEKGEKIQQFVSKDKVKGVGWNVRFHGDGFVVAAVGGGDGGFLFFWKAAEANEFFKLKLPAVARDLDMHADQLRLVTPHHDGVLRIWQMSPKPA